MSGERKGSGQRNVFVPSNRREEVERERGKERMEGRGRWQGGGEDTEDRDEDARRAKWRGEERGARGRSTHTGVCVCRVRACVRKEWRIEAKGEIHRRWIG